MGNISKTFELILSARDGASKVLSNFAKEAEHTTGTVSKLTKKLGALAAVVGVAAVGTFVKSVINANDAMQDMSDRTGVSVEKLAGLTQIAAASDVSLETLAKSLYKLGVAAVKTPEIFEAFGISVNDASGKLKSSDALFAESADIIAGISDPARQAAAATALFGKAGLELLPVLKTGSAGMKAWADDTKRLGGETSTAVAKLSGDFNDNLQRVGLVFKGITNDMLGGLLPAFNLLLGTFIEFAAIAREGGNSADKAKEGFSGIGSVLETVINIVGAVGNVFEALYDITTAVFKSVNNGIQKFISDIAAYKGFLVAFISGDVKGAYAALYDSAKRAKKMDDDLAVDLEKRFSGERFWSKLERSGTAAMKKMQAAAGEAGKAGEGAVKMLASVGSAQIKTTLDQIDALGVVSEKASAKAKKAFEDQKKVVDDFEKLVKSLNKIAPKDGTLGQKIDKASKADELRLKKGSLLEKFAAADAAEADGQRITSLQARVAAAQAAAEKDAGFYAQQALRDAQTELANEQYFQKERSRQAELDAADKEAAEKAISEQKRDDIRAAAASELKDIYAQIDKNEKANTSNEGEIERLRAIGALLQENKDKATGVFSATEISKYASEIEKLANAAAKTDKDTAKAENEAQLEKTKAKLEELRAMIKKVEFGVEDESIIREATRIAKTIQDKIDAIVLPGKLTQNYDSKGLQADPRDTAKKYADGGRVHGPGTSRQDNIPIWVSANEYIMPAHRMRQAGMYDLMESLRGGGLNMRNIGARNKFADGGGVMPQMSGNTGNAWTLDIRTNSGTINVTPNTTQDQLNRELRKQNQRRS